MALNKDFPQSPHAILYPGLRWFPVDETLRETSMEKLMPPLVWSCIAEFQALHIFFDDPVLPDNGVDVCH